MPLAFVEVARTASCARPGRRILLSGEGPGAGICDLGNAPGREEARHAVRAGPPGASVGAHSHSIVPGGFDVTSSTTRLTSRTSFVMRFEIFASTSYGRRVQSAVMASSEDTGRSTIGCP